MKSMLSFMTAVVVRDDEFSKWRIPEDRTLEQIYRDCPTEWPSALVHLSQIARDNERTEH